MIDFIDSIPNRIWYDRTPRQRVAQGVLGVGVAAAVFSGLLLDMLLAVPGLRSLPGVNAVLPVDAPVYARSIFGVPTPLSVAVTADSRFLYVVEGGGDRFVRKIRLADGESVATLAPPLTEPGSRKPIAVAIGNGFVYVVDRLRRTVDVYDAQDGWVGVLPAPRSDEEWQPLSVDTDADGRAYVTNTDTRAAVVVVYDATRHISEEWGSIEADGLALSFPNGVALGPDGRLVVSDSNNARLVAFERTTQQTTVYGNDATASLALPRGIALDSRGVLLVTDANDHAVSGWDFRRTGNTRVFMFGEPGIGDGAFLFPNDLAVGGQNRVYVADRDNDRIQIWRY